VDNPASRVVNQDKVNTVDSPDSMTSANPANRSRKKAVKASPRKKKTRNATSSVALPNFFHFFRSRTHSEAPVFWSGLPFLT
jgi:hypothetical protein